MNCENPPCARAFPWERAIPATNHESVVPIFGSRERVVKPARARAQRARAGGSRLLLSFYFPR